MADPEVMVAHLGDDHWVIALQGEHDISTGPDIHAALNRVFETGTSVVFDLSDATFIDASVIRTMIAAHQHAQTNRGEDFVVVAPPTSFAAHVIDLTGLTGLLTIYNNKEAALKRHQ